MMHTRRRFLLVVILLCVMLSIGLGIVVGSSVLFPQQHANHFVRHITVQHKAPSSLQDHSLDIASGAFLIIPAIGVKAPIEAVGTDTSGHLAVPKYNQWNSVGWYQAGPHPGGDGSSVIDGHLNRPGGAPAVFWNLQHLHNGDMVVVQDKNGHVLHFKVIKVAYYAPSKAPLAQIYGNTHGIFLNLITCAGDWDVDQNQYNQRLVVYTQLSM